MLAHNSIEWVAMDLAILAEGLIVVPLYARQAPAELVAMMKEYPAILIELSSHTDSRGNDAYNQRLSEKRAAAVQDFLVSQGVPSTNVSARGFGESDPVASNNTATGRQLNRRVEMVVSGSSIGHGASPAAGAGGTATPATGGVAGSATGTTQTPSQPASTNPGIAAPASTPPATNPNGVTTPSGTTPPANNGQQPPATTTPPPK